MNLSTSGHSFVILCVPCRSELVKYARRLTANVDSAEDIVQDALVKALGAWMAWTPDGLAPDQAARAWLYRIVGNLFVNSVRDARLHRLIQSQCIPDIVHGLYGDVETIGCVLSSADPQHESFRGRDGIRLARQIVISCRDHAMLVTEDVSSEVLVAIARLHPKRRIVIERYYFRGETCEIIAKAMGIPASSVRTLLGRARVKLAPLLESFARANYDLDAGVDAHAETAKESKADTHRVNRIVRNDHRLTLPRIKVPPYQPTARRL